MKYLGSKAKIAKYILPIILKDRIEGQWYVEPFIGGCNTIKNVKDPRIGNDNNYYLIQMWRAFQEGWAPPLNLDEPLYNDIKINKDNYPPYLVGYVGFNLSFGSRFFGGIARCKNPKRNYCEESYKNLSKDIPKIKNILFYNEDYKDLRIPKNSIIYCDPPYENVFNYNSKFDHKEFWNWCNIQIKLGNQVFVSEYQAPEDWITVWQKEHQHCFSFNRINKTTIIEKLFTKFS